MFCPNCGAEYRTGFIQCVDCQVDLVPELSSEPEKITEEPIELVTILTTIDFPFLTVVKSILESADIPCFTRGEEVLSVFPGLPMGRSSGDEGGIVAVQVPRDRAEEAEKLLVQLTEEDQEQIAPGDLPDDDHD
ncbi:hypothetical protein ACFL27_02430 [candidate division CSSED10-310 bacterium]|uniref:DUF2007 domain-containing protein n=1 Tax=candidate division CSSED10-310 bacterium TaxID=2855610 RepID=A0ABV6YSI5_UNCC1